MCLFHQWEELEVSVCPTSCFKTIKVTYSAVAHWKVCVYKSLQLCHLKLKHYSACIVCMYLHAHLYHYVYAQLRNGFLTNKVKSQSALMECSALERPLVGATETERAWREAALDRLITHRLSTRRDEELWLEQTCPPVCTNECPPLHQALVL